VEEITSAITELSAQSRQSAINAGEITDISQKTLQNAEDGLKKITSMVISINDISESSKSIAKIMKTIDEIAFQTNLLALNAAVEAARAGRHGKGFAVVAEEVNNLSKRSSLAAKETADIIESSLKKIEEGKSITEDTQGAFQKILQGIQEVNKLNEEIAQATIQQVKGIEQVESGIQEIDKVTQQNASIAEENAAACGELSQQSQALYNVVSSADSKENNDKFETADNGRLHRIASGGNNHGKNYYKDRRTDEKYHLRENTRRHLIVLPDNLIFHA
jgi:methyl-accepting chemotaxis protein